MIQNGWLHLAKELAKKPRQIQYTYHNFNFLSDIETIKHIIQNDVGVVRYGDGESVYLHGYPRSFEKYDPHLRSKIENILQRYDEYTMKNEYILSVPLGKIYDQIDRPSTSQWTGMAKYGIRPYISPNQVYGSPFCFRINNVVTHSRREYTKEVSQLFKNREIIVVADKDRYSSYIDANEFVKIPSENCYEKYGEIKSEVEDLAENYSSSVLVLVTAGVTATALSADLNNIGIRTYDVGKLFRHLN